MEESALLFRNLNPSSTSDSLQMYIERISAAAITNKTFHHDKTAVMVFFSKHVGKCLSFGWAVYGALQGPVAPINIKSKLVVDF